MVNGDTLFIAGGYSNTGGVLSSTLFVMNGTMVQWGPDLPKPLLDPCVVTVNSTHVFIGGGLTVNEDDELSHAGADADATYLHHLGEGGCTELPGLLQPRSSHACSKVGKHVEI